MKTQLMTATAAAFFLGLGSAAIAQDPATTPGATLSASNPSQVTCSELTAMDSNRAEGFLYFIAGYHQAERFGTTTTGMDTGSAPGTDAASTAATGTGTAGTGTTATDPAATAGTDTAATTLPSDSGAAADTTGATAATGTAGAEQFSSMGFVDIPVAQIMSACEGEPQARVADLLQRELGQGGTTAQ